MKTTTVKLPKELYKKAMLKAAQNEIYSLSELVRTLLTEYVSIDNVERRTEE